MKRCPYCLAAHDRKRADFCCQEHADRWHSHTASVSAGRERATDAILRRVQARHRKQAAA